MDSINVPNKPAPAVTSEFHSTAHGRFSRNYLRSAPNDERLWATDPVLPLRPGGVGYTSLLRVRLTSQKPKLSSPTLDKDEKGIEKVSRQEPAQSSGHMPKPDCVSTASSGLKKSK